MTKGKYIIRVNCSGFKDYAVIADSEEKAIEYARNNFQCDSLETDSWEVLEPDSSYSDNDYMEVF